MAQKERVDVLNAPQKNTALFKVLFLKNQEKTGKINRKCGALKILAFSAFILKVFQNSSLLRTEVFCVAFSESRHSF